MMLTDSALAMNPSTNSLQSFVQTPLHRAMFAVLCSSTNALDIMPCVLELLYTRCSLEQRSATVALTMHVNVVFVLCLCVADAAWRLRLLSLKVLPFTFNIAYGMVLAATVFLLLFIAHAQALHPIPQSASIISNGLVQIHLLVEPDATSKAVFSNQNRRCRA